MEESQECVDNFRKVEFYHTFCKERQDPRTIVELATMTLGDEEEATGPLLEKSSQKSIREAYDEAEGPQCACQQGKRLGRSEQRMTGTRS